MEALSMDNEQGKQEIKKTRKKGGIITLPCIIGKLARSPAIIIILFIYLFILGTD